MKKLEIWKDIPGYENLYQVSNLGRIKSLYYRLKIRNKKREGIMKLFKRESRGIWYLKVGLYKNRKRLTKRVHRLVAFAFIKNPNKYPEINHKNGNSIDNRLENLEWCTQAMNLLHSYKLGRVVWNKKMRLTSDK